VSPTSPAHLPGAGIDVGPRRRDQALGAIRQHQAQLEPTVLAHPAEHAQRLALERVGRRTIVAVAGRSPTWAVCRLLVRQRRPPRRHGPGATSRRGQARPGLVKAFLRAGVSPRTASPGTSPLPRRGSVVFTLTSCATPTPPASSRRHEPRGAHGRARPRNTGDDAALRTPRLRHHPRRLRHRHRQDPPRRGSWLGRPAASVPTASSDSAANGSRPA
jgi:hypothetical protein